MDASDAKQVFQIPSFARPETYNFDATPESFEIYRELSQISEELLKWRSKNI